MNYNQGLTNYSIVTIRSQCNYLRLMCYAFSMIYSVTSLAYRSSRTSSARCPPVRSVTTRHNGDQGILAGLVEGGIVLGQDQQDLVVPPGKVLIRHTEIVFRIAEKVNHVVFVGLGEQLQHGAAQLFHNCFLPLGKTVCFL